MAIDPLPAPYRKKVLILVSRGGGGHKTAASAIQEILQDTYDVEINYVLQDILGPIDILNVMTKGFFTGEDLYNWLLKRHQKKLLQWMMKAGKKQMTNEKIEALFEKYLSNLSQKPDLIISPTPLINYGLACAAHRHQIPLIIIPTDLDGSTFLQGFPETPTPLNFKLALPYDDPLIREATLKNTKLRDEQIIVTGFPVRSACTKKYSPQEKKQIRSSFHLFESYKTLTLIMGAVGGNLILEHVKALTTLNPSQHNFSLQLNVCTGHNTSIAAKIKKFLTKKGSPLGESSFILPTGLIIHVRKFVPNIIELMAVSDVIITKTGSCTVNEAIYLDKPVILDNTKHSTARYFTWEQFNIPFVEKHNLGASFTDSQKLPMLALSMLKFPQRRALEGGNERHVFGEVLLRALEQALDI